MVAGPPKPLYVGHRIKLGGDPAKVYNSGAGYTLNREAVMKLVVRLWRLCAGGDDACRWLLRACPAHVPPRAPVCAVHPVCGAPLQTSIHLGWACCADHVLGMR